jgi:hypothetical protein
MSRSVLSRYRTPMFIVAIVLGLAQIAMVLPWRGLLGSRFASTTGTVSRLIALLEFVVIPAAMSFDGTRHFRDMGIRARRWWYLGGLIAAILGSIGVAVGLVQVASGATGFADEGTATDMFLLGLLGGLLLGIWSGAFMGWIGNLLGRLTIRLGI